LHIGQKEVIKTTLLLFLTSRENCVVWKELNELTRAPHDSVKSKSYVTTLNRTLNNCNPFLVNFSKTQTYYKEYVETLFYPYSFGKCFTKMIAHKNAFFLDKCNPFFNGFFHSQTYYRRHLKTLFYHYSFGSYIIEHFFGSRHFTRLVLKSIIRK